MNSTYSFDNSTFYSGMFGTTGVFITNCSGTDKGVTATSASNIGIRSPATITIDNSQVDAQGYYSDLMGAGGVGIQNGSKVKATSSDDCGIFAETDLTVESSEIYASGSYLGIYIGNEGNVSDTWIRAEEGIGTGTGDFSTYKPVNSVTIQSGNWWVAGDAKVPDGALIKQDDQIEIPKDTSLSIGGTKILGKAEGIMVHTDGALLLPVGTVIERADGMKLTIGTGGGKTTLDGEVSDFSTYTVTLETNGGTINSGNIISYTYGVGATLPTADDMAYTGHTFKGWYEDSSFSGNPVANITATDTGDKTYYAKWLSSDAGVTAVSVNNTPGDITGTTITVLLPLGTILPTDRETISITPATGAVVSNLQLAESDGSKWTFTVTAEDKTTTEGYTINVSVAENPAAGDIVAAKAEIQNTIWTVEQTTANEEAAVKSWIEKQLATMSLRGVDYKVSIENFTKATAGSSTNENGTGGSFIFTVSLSKGKVEQINERYACAGLDIC